MTELKSRYDTDFLAWSKQTGNLGHHQEINAATTAVLRSASYTEEQVLGDWFPEERRVSNE
jgi:hypothetical protein